MWGDRWRACGYVALLERRYRLVVPDLLGHGESDKPGQPGVYGMSNLASDVVAVLDEVGVDRVHVWGYSMGAMVAERLAVAVPDRVLSLTFGGFPPGLSLEQRQIELVNDELPSSLEDMFQDWPPALADLYIANNELEAIGACQASLCEDPTTIADLQSVPHPTLAYIGDADPRFDLTRRQCEALPCLLEIVRGDHFAGFAQADTVTPLVVAHLEASARG
jgi:pimeloyl-ACP methyl ester carboxylesterase